MNRRNTIQRELVLEAVRSLKCHATADEVYACIVQTYPSIGKGTVYRNLNLLSESGEIKKVKVTDGADHFDHNLTDHYHINCISCGRVFDVDMDTIPNVMDSIKNRHGIQFLDYDILFHGICPNCQRD